MNNIVTSILLAFLSIFFFGCSESEKTTADPIAVALDALQKRTNDDAFVIIETLPTKNYVQFTTYTDQSIFVDFPIFSHNLEADTFVGLVETEKVTEISDIEGYTLTRFITEEEEGRLREYLERWGVSIKLNQEKGTTPDGKVVSFFTSIECEFNLKPDKQSEFVHGVFTKVFQLKDYTLNIAEN